ncbi:MAG: DNA repair protein RecO [Verrucomicrobiae bacterium]|nr:DNA repair protein RecO [Verrucomicrobiae bacterium]
MSDPETDEGLILRVHALTETSLVVRWLTRDSGRLATVARGARQPKSPFLGRLDLFVSAQISFQRARQSELHTLREVSVLGRFPALASDYARLAQASYAVALIERVSEPETPVPELHALFGQFLAHLESAPAQSRSVYALEARVLAAGGLDPVQAAGDLGPDARDLLQNLRDTPWPELAALHPAGGAVREVNQRLQIQIADAWGRVPRGRGEALRR